MKLTKPQSTILRLVAGKPDELWYPCDQIVYVEDTRLFLSGSSVAAIVLSLERKGLVTRVPTLAKYACKITDLGREIAKLEKGKPLAFIYSL